MTLKINREALERLSGAERDQAEQILRRVQITRERNPLAFYEPHAKQQAFHSFTAQTKCFFGGNQSGKTTGGLADDIIQAVDESALPDHLKPYKKFQPPFLCRIMAESFPVLETTLIQKLQELLPIDQLLGGSWKSAYERDLRVLHFQNGSKFFFQTYEMDVAKMGGASIHRVHFDEEPRLAVFNECRLRVMAKSGDLLFTMTPVQGMTWTHEQLWKRRGDQVDKDIYRAPDLDVVIVDMDDNPVLTEKDKALALAGMSKEEREARKEGRFVAMHGLIYGEFNKDNHVIPSEPLPEAVNVVVGIDPGYKHPAGVVWAYLTPDDDMVVFHEERLEYNTAKQVCELIHAVNDEYGLNPIYYVIDPSARNKNHETGRNLQMEYADNGIVTIPGQHDRKAGWNRVRERFQRGALHITTDCPLIVEEIQQYRLKPQNRQGENTREEPVKLNDDLVDALRYLVMSRPYLPDRVIKTNETRLQRLMREDMERLSEPQAENIGQFGGVAA